MPELPDVEVFRRYVDATALHQPIAGVHGDRLEDLRAPSPQRLAGTLDGKAIERTDRHGKFLFAGVEGDRWLVLHFGMTGSLAYYRNEEAAPDHVRLRLDLVNGYHLAYRCPRLLGRIDVASDVERFVRDEALGPDALAIGRRAFHDLLGHKRGTIKGALMDQSTLAGIGNVYVDEILYQARIHPERDAAGLDADARGRVHRVMRRVLRTAIGRQADVEAFPRSWLTPRRRNGGRCPRGHDALERIKVSGRTTVFCARCQRR